MLLTTSLTNRARLQPACLFVVLALTASCVSPGADDTTSSSKTDDDESSGDPASTGEQDDDGDDTEGKTTGADTAGSTSSSTSGGGSTSTSTTADGSSTSTTSTTFGSTGTSTSAGDTTTTDSAEETGDPTTGDDSGEITCPSSPLSPGDSTIQLMIGGSMRSYILHVPAAYDGSSPVPLIVDFHPLGGSGQSERMGSPYPARTDSEGVIMAFPSGLQGPSGGAWNVEGCCVADTDDVAFARALVADVQSRACIDPKRVYAVGFSMGGGMSHYLACHAADVFAAVAPAAFDLLEENIGGCQPARPITVVSFRSTGDPIVPYDGGFSSVVPGMPITFLGAQGTFEAWADMNQCTGSAAMDANGCSAYSDCADGTEVVLCTTQGGGHDYGNATIGWPILREHTLP